MIYELFKLFILFAKIGLFTIGGGLAMIPLIQQELIAQSYMSAQEALDMVAISQMTPGPFAMNAATFVGMRLHGVAGALATSLGVVLPSVAVCMVVAKRFFKYMSAPPVRAVLRGIRPVVYALILSGMISICGEALFPEGFSALPDWPVLALAAVVTALMLKTKINPVWLVAACGVVGAVFLR